MPEMCTRVRESRRGEGFNDRITPTLPSTAVQYPGTSGTWYDIQEQRNHL